MFYHTVPAFQLFQCVRAPPKGYGGQTTFIQTKRIINWLNETEQELLRSTFVTYDTPLLSYFGGYPVTFPLQV